MPFIEWMDSVIYAHSRALFSNKKEQSISLGRVAVTMYTKLRGLNSRHVLLQFWRLGVQGQLS